MGASGSAEEGRPLRGLGQRGQRQGAESGARRGERIRRVRVTGAGVSVVNGIYYPMPDFAGGEVFFMEVNRSSINKIYIRRLSEAEQDTWVITLSPQTLHHGDHLYKRVCERAPWYGEQEQLTPPLFGWSPCTAADGVAERLASQVAQGVPKLKYHYGPMEDINWDCKPPGPGQVDRRQDRMHRPQTGVSSSLVVSVIGCFNIPESRAREYHVACQVPGKNEIVESVPVPAVQNPEFRLKTPLQSWKHPDDLRFTVFAERTIMIGEATLGYQYFNETGFVGEVPVTLHGFDSEEVTMSVCVTMPGQSTPGIDVELRREHGSKFGIEIAPDSQMNCLCITKIMEGGLVAKWNFDHPDERVELRDKIVEIDGQSGSVRALLQKFVIDGPRTIRLRILRAGT